ALHGTRRHHRAALDRHVDGNRSHRDHAGRRPSGDDMSSWNTWAARELDGLRAIDRYRQNVPFDGDGPVGKVGDRELISFASNDYLGLASHPEVKRAAISAIERFGTGAMASRLI